MLWEYMERLQNINVYETRFVFICICVQINDKFKSTNKSSISRPLWKYMERKGSSCIFQMFLQSFGPDRMIITFVAFIWFVPWVNLEMCPKIAGVNRCIFVLVPFLRLHSSVRLQMAPQSSRPDRRKFALVAFEGFFS